MPIDQGMEQTIDENVSTRAALTPTQTPESGTQIQTAESASLSWSIGDKCTWPDCTSAAEFKTVSSFNMHVNNMHTDPLLCSAPNCQHRTPFGRKSDLRRHEQSAHSAERNFVCTVPSCDARVKEFARKDHLWNHMRDLHDYYFCPLNHCRRSTKCYFDKPEDVQEHITVEHGPYECALNACARAPPSEFSETSLLRHLKNHHGVHSSFSLIGSELNGRNEFKNVFVEADLGRITYCECKICKEQPCVNEVLA